MSAYQIEVVRADGRIRVMALRPDIFSVAVRHALEKSRGFALHGCPLGDPASPLSVDIRDIDGSLLLRIAIDRSLNPLII